MTKQVRVLLMLLLALFTACKSTSTVRNIETRQYVFSDTSYSKIDSLTWKIIQPYHDSLDLVMNEKLAYSMQAMVKNNPEGLLGNFAADACADQSNKIALQKGIMPPDFTFLNSGGLRTSLPQGEITRRNIFELMPFENELVIVSLNELQTTTLLNYIAERGGAPVSGVKMEIKNKKVQTATINGQLLDKEKTYRVLTSDYLANGGDNLEFLKSAKKESLNLKVRDAMIYYLQDLNKKGDSLTVKIDGRIINVE